jgi:hypothetical protein
MIAQSFGLVSVRTLGLFYIVIRYNVLRADR